MNITIQINTDGKAFEDDLRAEIRFVLCEYTDNNLNKSKSLLDSLGNRCGTVTITEEK